MDNENMVFRSVYVDPDVDHALRVQADQAKTSKGEMFRRYLDRGMLEAKRSSKKRGRSVTPFTNSSVTGTRLTMRTVYLPVEVDNDLRTQAFGLRTTKSDLIRQFLRAGMQAMQPDTSAKAATRKAATSRQVATKKTTRTVKKHEPATL